MEKEKPSGLMEDPMKEIMKMIRNMAMGGLFGLMGGNILENGKGENNMGEGPILIMEERKNKVNGLMGKESGGLMSKFCKLYFKLY